MDTVLYLPLYVRKHIRNHVTINWRQILYEQIKGEDKGKDNDTAVRNRVCVVVVLI